MYNNNNNNNIPSNNLHMQSLQTVTCFGMTTNLRSYLHSKTDSAHITMRQGCVTNVPWKSRKYYIFWLCL